MWEKLVSLFGGLNSFLGDLGSGILDDLGFGSSTAPYNPVSEATDLASNNGNPLLSLVPKSGNPRHILGWLENFGGIGALYNDLTGKTAQATEFLQQDYLLDKEQEFEREMETRREEYNSEPARIKRMQDAGLNVNLMSGAVGSSVSGGSSPIAPSVNSAVGASGNAVGSMLDAMLASANIKKADSEVQNIDAQTSQILQDTFLKPISLFHQIQLWDSSAKKYCAEAGLASENAEFIKSQRIYFNDTKDLNKQKLQEEVNHIIEESKLIRQKFKESKASIDLMKKEGEMYDAYASESGQRKEMLSQQYEAIENLFGGIPFSVDDKSRISALLASDNPEDNELGEKLLQGVVYCVGENENAVIDANFHNFGKSFLMDIGEGVGNAFQFLPFMFGGRPRHIKGFGR